VVSERTTPRRRSRVAPLLVAAKAYAYHGAGVVLSRLPERAVRALAVVLGRVLVASKGRSLQILRENLETLEADDPGMVRLAVRKYVDYVLEYVRLPFADPAALRARVRVEGCERLPSVGSGAPGLVLVSTHSGNWDASAAWLSERLGGLAAITSGDPGLVPPRYQRTYERLGVQLIPGVGGAFDEAAALLVSGRSLLLLCDFAPPGAATIDVTMSGARSALLAVPFVLAARAHAPLVPIGSWVEERGAVGLGIGTPVKPWELPGSRAAAQAVAEQFGAMLRAHPADWHAAHLSAWR